MNGRRASRAEEGFSLIEILVVILIIGVLAAIAIPVFVGQKTKAVDASAKEAARSGMQAAETFATDHNGNYAGMEAKDLHELDAALQVAPGSGNAYISSVKSQESGGGYVITAKSTNGDSYTISRTQAGSVTRTCSAEAANRGGCANSSW
ncbi:MAG TPA: prepilin-type N-terminal cleavage/methylation domain-containing protein [Solirubrobacteraceae bacterium]|jgi:type IV pilus assembly protein PilA|nr:prepilin-type N-terminal cleavage/methylation domain-containing protein [Solirubrobacteraceae bacterium]